MKKFLSLVLALAMTMSLVTVSAGAKDYTDDSKIEYKEAVDVVSALGIVGGYEDGSFNPQNTLTRGAAAKIICNLILGTTTASALRADTAPYSDVPTTNTFAGYIAYCQKEGIISGYADGTFKPAATLTGYAFMKMLLGALGYDSDIEGYTGANWSIAVGKRALGIGLDDGNDEFVGVNAVTREEACLYAFNTLKATMVEYDAKTTVSVEGAQVTVGGSEAKNVSQDGYKSYTGDKDDTTLEFCEKNFEKLKADKTATNGFEAPATTWKYDGDEIGTYDNDADATLVVADADKSLEELITDGDYLDISEKDIASEDGKYTAEIFFNGDKVGTYEDHKDDTDLAGKGDIIDVYENDDNDVATIVIRSYTYAKIDAVDDDLSKTLENRGASVELSLVDIKGDALGNGDYYDDYNQDDQVLNGYTSNYKEGTVLAVAVSAKDNDTILDSYVAETVTGTPSAARGVETYSYSYPAIAYQGAATGVKNGSITVDGTKYNYAAQFTGLKTGESVDFDKEYSVYLTAEGYALAVDGDVTASLSDVYYVVGGYRESKMGTSSFYAQVVSLKDGTVQELKLDGKDALKGEPIADSDEFTPVGKLFKMDESSNKWTGTEYTSTKYVVKDTATLTENVTGSSSMVRTSAGNFYLEDTTNFIAVEDTGANIDVKTATGTMSMAKDSVTNVIVIANDNDALYVIYVGTELKGATSSADIVYLDAQPKSENKDGWEASLWFMDGLKNEDVTSDDDYAQGFYRFTVNSDGIYELNKYDSDDKIDTAEVESDSTGYTVGTVFTTAKNNVITAPAEGKDADGNTYYNTIEFVGISMSGATVIDTRTSSAMKADDYSNEINTTSKLVSALNKGYVKADVYVEDGKITFIAVTECANA